MLRKANDSLQATINQQVKRIKTLKSSKRDNDDEKEISDQITNELIDKINAYEGSVEELTADNQNLIAQIEELNEYAQKVPELEGAIQELQEQLLNSQNSEEVNSKFLHIKEDSILKNTENQRLKEKNEKLQKEIEEFKREFDNLQDYIDMKDDQIGNKFRDEEVCISIQMLLKELILLNKKQAFDILGIQSKVSKEDLDRVIQSHYLTDPYIRFVIVNSVAYLQECKESLNYLKQKYAESEMKYDDVFGKYQNCQNQNAQLQNNSNVLENNLNHLIEENQKLNQEKFLILQNKGQNPSILQSIDTVNLQRTLKNEKENLSQYAFDDDESSVNIYQGPLSSRMHGNQMSVDQSNLLSTRMSQNLSNYKNGGTLSSRVSVDCFQNKEGANKNTSFLSNKNCASTNSISFYKPQTTFKKYNRKEVNRSSVSMRSNVNSRITDRNNSKRIDQRIHQDNSSNRNTSRATKHYKK